MPGRHLPRKRFGQHFLADPHHLARIVAAIAPREADTMVEIGPGQGALTAPLLKTLRHLTAIEIDRDLVAGLRTRYDEAQLTLISADALSFDFATLASPLRVVGNLPYNISTPLLFHLARFAPRLVDIHALLQREIVDRMAAAPGDKTYGRLSVMLQAQFAIERLCVIPPGAFNPPPQVTSALVRLTPLGARAPAIADHKLFSAIVAAAFGQRRKTLRNAWRNVLTAADFTTLDIDAALRAEMLTVEAFLRVADHVAARAAAGV